MCLRDSILTQEFVIDGQDGIREPIGMSGMRLEVKTHIVTGAVSAAQNIVKCVRRCGLEEMCIRDRMAGGRARGSAASRNPRSWPITAGNPLAGARRLGTTVAPTLPRARRADAPAASGAARVDP